MATTLQATSQPLSEPTSSVATTTEARMTTESSSSSLPRRSDNENRGPRRPSGSSSNSKHSKRHTNQPILVWLQRKIGGNRHALKKEQENGLANATNTLNGVSAGSPKLGARGDSVESTVKSSRKHGLHATKNSEPARSMHSPSAKSDSLRPDSAWGLTLEPEADDDASIRPLPPTSPPSPVPSRMTHDSDRTSGGYTSDLRSSSRSAGTPSTKPTTLMSIEFGAGGHIAQVPSISSSVQPPRTQQFASPPTTTSGSPVSTRSPNPRGSATGPTSVSFPTSLANGRSLTASSAAPSVVAGAVNNLISESTQTPAVTVVVPASPVSKLAIHIPGHSQFHPRNNPRPASPPPDNASTLTLASSTFAVSHASPRTRSMAAERDIDNAASMRALRPSSRRGSWGSDETGWSAAALSTQTGVSSAGPMLLNFGGGPGSTMAGGYKRRGPGSIATARSAWSYRASGRDGTGDGLDHVTNDDEAEECEEDPESADGDRETRITSEELTPTEDVVFDFATTSPTSMTRQSIIMPHEIPLPPSPPLTPVEIV